MPTSPYAHLYPMVEFLSATRPLSLLDIGLGNGKIGFIARDLLDVMLGERYRKEAWQVRIDGIEVFPDYIQNHQKAIYNDIFIGDAFEVIDSLGQYDMLVLGDVLEHFEKGKALQFLDKCIAHTNRHIIICIPLGAGWDQGAIYGNPNEKHLSCWQLEELKPLACSYKLFQYTPGVYGIFLVRKEDYIDCKIKALKAPNARKWGSSNIGLRKRHRQ